MPDENAVQEIDLAAAASEEPATSDEQPAPPELESPGQPSEVAANTPGTFSSPAVQELMHRQFEVTQTDAEATGFVATLKPVHFSGTKLEDQPTITIRNSLPLLNKGQRLLVQLIALLLAVVMVGGVRGQGAGASAPAACPTCGVGPAATGNQQPATCHRPRPVRRVIHAGRQAVRWTLGCPPLPRPPAPLGWGAAKNV